MLEQRDTPDRNAAPRAHSGAEERGKEEGKAEKNSDGLTATPSPTEPFRQGVESGVKLNLGKGGGKVF